jgi:hypothetical protein
MTASSPIDEAPPRTVHGSIRASWPMLTVASMNVLSGSTIVTPARMWSSAIRARMSRSAAASWTRSLIPIASSGRGAATTLTGWPSAVARPTRSVR